MEMRIVVPDAATASALAERLTLVLGAERISFPRDRQEVDVRVRKTSSFERGCSDHGLCSGQSIGRSSRPRDRASRTANRLLRDGSPETNQNPAEQWVGQRGADDDQASEHRPMAR
jgi:hypothetical protein